MFVPGTYEEDGPATWEALTPPRDEYGLTGSRTPILRRPCVLRVHAGVRRKKKTPATRKVKGEGNRSRDRWVHRESEGRIGAEKVGNDWHRTHRSKGGQSQKPEEGKGLRPGMTRAPVSV